MTGGVGAAAVNCWKCQGQGLANCMTCNGNGMVNCFRPAPQPAYGGAPGYPSATNSGYPPVRGGGYSNTNYPPTSGVRSPYGY